MIQEAKKSEYQTPTLVEYGSVRNLTGGSLGQLGDGSSTMRAKP